MIFDHSISNNLVMPNLYEKFYEDAKLNNYQLAMFAVATHCNDHNIIEYMLKHADNLLMTDFRDKYYLMLALANKL